MPFPPVNRFPAGMAVQSAEFRDALNGLVDIANSVRSIDSDGSIEIMQGLTNTLIRTVGGSSGGSNAGSVSPMVYVSDGDDYVECKVPETDDDDSVETDNSEEVVTYKVLKPYLLRRTPFHGMTINGLTYAYSSGSTRTVTDGTDTITENITPPWQAEDGDYAGDIIYVVPYSSEVEETVALDDGTLEVHTYSLSMMMAVCDRVWARQCST